MKKTLFILLVLLFCGCDEQKDITKINDSINNQNITIEKLQIHDSNKSIKILSTAKRVFKTDVDKPLFINLFSSRCRPCIAQMNSLKILSKKYKDIQFVGILVNQNISDKALKKFVTKMKLNYPIVTNANIAKLKHILGLKANITPISIIYDKQGNYYTHYLGAVLQEMIERDLDNLKGKK